MGPSVSCGPSLRFLDGGSNFRNWGTLEVRRSSSCCRNRGLRSGFERPCARIAPLREKWQFTKRLRFSQFECAVFSSLPVPQSL